MATKSKKKGAGKAGGSKGGKAQDKVKGKTPKSPKEILYKIDPDDDKILLRDILLKIEELQTEYPDLDIFFDGDEYAICGRERKE